MSYCAGNCILNKPNPSLIYQSPLQCSTNVNPGYGFTLTGQTNPFGSTPDNSLFDFLEIIADKTDTDACVAFLEKRRALHAQQVQEIERIRKQYQDDLEKCEKDFLHKCQKYRPSITEEILKRIKDLKVFF